MENLSTNGTNNEVSNADKSFTVNENHSPSNDSLPKNLFESKSSSDSSSLDSSSSISVKYGMIEANNTATSNASPRRQSGVDLEDLVMKQKYKFKNGDRAKSPAFGIPIDCLQPDGTLLPYQIAWIESQQQKAKDIIFDDRFEDAIAMVTDGRAKTLVSNGYNMYGEKMKDGTNFFGKLLSEDYGMYDWIPTWVTNCDSQLYYEVKQTPLL